MTTWVNDGFAGELFKLTGSFMPPPPPGVQPPPLWGVEGHVEEAFAALKAALDRFNEISMKFAEPMSDDEMNELLVEQGDLQETIDSQDGWELDPPWITNTVGFAGPNQEYTLAVMYNLEGYGDADDVGFSYGINTLTQIASILFQGHQTQQPTAQASAVP